MDTNQYNKLFSKLLEMDERQKRIEEKLDADISKELLTPKEVQEILKIGKTTYQRYVDDKVFTQIKIVGKAYVERAEIERLIEEGKI